MWVGGQAKRDNQDYFGYGAANGKCMAKYRPANRILTANISSNFFFIKFFSSVCLFFVFFFPMAYEEIFTIVTFTLKIRTRYIHLKCVCVGHFVSRFGSYRFHCTIEEEGEEWDRLWMSTWITNEWAQHGNNSRTNNIIIINRLVNNLLYFHYT